MTNNSRVAMGPKDFFLHVGSLVMLYVGLGALVRLLFQVIDYKWVNELSYFTPSIAWPVAILIVLFPVYILLFWLIRKTYTQDETKKDLPIRKWLTYLTLFIAGAIIIGNLITVLYYFLDGQIFTINFVLKILSLLVLSLLVFVFFLLDLRNKLQTKGCQLFGLMALIIIVGSIVAGFSVMGSPATQRAVRYDQERIRNLQDIQNQVVQHWQTRGSLPDTLDDLDDSLSFYTIPSDPVTRESYEYNKTGDLEFSLCSNFNLDSRGQIARTYYPTRLGGENWQYEAGNWCFDRTIDPDLYPPFRR